jgi:hypothetical protein
MAFEFREEGSLPKLAWLAVLRKGEPSGRVIHGPWVETHGRFFVEGAWDGAFSDGDFADAQMLMGSGGIALDGSFLFCGAAHPMERLYLLRVADALLISQSLVFTLRAAGLRPDPRYIPYQADLLRFQQGLRHHVGELPLEGGQRITLVHYRNVRVDPDLQVSILEKPAPPRFTDFRDYERFLVEGLRRFRDNAAAPERRVRYTPLATVSSGYDSAACAALSTEIFCEEAATIRSARPEDGGGPAEDDRGTPVAEALGLRVREFERDAYRSLATLPEAEFVACGDLGQDLPIVAMEECLAGRFVLTGEHGDTTWSRNWDLRKDRKDARDIVRPSCTGCSLIEFRLRVGFIHLPLPCVGARSLPDLKRICQSEEMRPWTLFNSYDRPIPRRFVEERGVARHLFGQRKKAVTVLLHRDAALAGLMGPASYEAFRRLQTELAPTRDPATQRHYDRMFGLYRLWSRLFSRVNRVLSRLGIPLGVPCPIPFRFRQPPGEPSYLFHWGFSEIADRYAPADPLLPATGPE